MNCMPYPELNEILYTTVLPNGLPVYVLPKPGFAQKTAYLAVNYGSIDTTFTWQGKAHRTPDGVAHYLEHKMFDLEGRDVAAEFSALGANSNAFTSYAMTAYYFTCTQAFQQCLSLLLTFVSTPYFTAESVEKERGIIGQEIRMYRDSADSQVYEDLFAALYRHHPVRVPIAGTEESIAAITPQTLYLCHGAFYQPANMVLCVVGDVDPEQVAEIAGGFFSGASLPLPIRDYGPAEALAAPAPLTRRVMDVAMPTFQLGFKTPWPGSGLAGARQRIVGDLAADALMGESSPLYLQLYRQGLIDSSFAAGYEDLPGIALLSGGGDSPAPEAVRDAILAEAGRLATQGIGEDLFRQLKRSALGRRLRGLDTISSTCFRLCAAHFDQAPYLDFPQLYAGIEKEDVEEFLGKTVVGEQCALAIVLPRTKEG